jgi:hypothetical protein
MKHSRLIVLLAGSTLMLAGAAAEAAQPGGGMRGHHGGGRGSPGGHHGHAMMMLRAADANGDNSITRAEVDSLQAEMFDWMDRNGDGYLDDADQSPVHARLREIRQQDRAERGGNGDGRGWGRRGGRDGGPRHMRADADEDGRVSRAEFLDRETRMFGRLDADENGTITPEELDAAAERRQDRRFWWRD